MTIQDLQQYRQLIENSANPTLTEDYEGRISDLADKILQTVTAMGEKINKADLERMINRGITWSLGSVPRSEVVKDVLAKLKGKIEIRKTMPGGPRKGAKTQGKQALQNLARWMSNALTDELGNVFPDGDPHDALMNIVSKVLRVDRMGDQKAREYVFGSPDLDLDTIRQNTDPRNWLNAKDWIEVVVYPLVMQEFKKVNKTDLYGYLADMWDQLKADATHDAEYSKNPQQYLQDRGLAGSNPYR